MILGFRMDKTLCQLVALCYKDECTKSTQEPELFDSKVFSTPRDLSSEVQSCYSSNPSQPLLCRDKVILILLIIFKAVKFVEFYVSVQVAEFSQCVVDWRSQALKAV